jgi:hypothetical protein
MNKETWYILTKWTTTQASKKKEILPFETTQMNVECIMLREVSQAQRDKFHMASLMWNLEVGFVEAESKKAGIRAGVWERR